MTRFADTLTGPTIRMAAAPSTRRGHRDVSMSFGEVETSGI
jgi:hypothetical protein